MFLLHDAAGPIDPVVVDDLLHDRLALCIFRGAVDRADCSALADRFAASPRVSKRGDQVPGRTLGTIHYLKTVGRYLDDSARGIADLAAFFVGCANPLDDALQTLAVQLGRRGARLRGGAFEGRPFCPMVMRSWQGDGRFSLLPHEDVSQLTHAPQQALEFCRAHPTVGNINLCLDNFDDPAHGAVRLWNYRPDAAERQRLGIGASGYPYPMDALARSACIELPVFPGDAYVINGRYVHAVTGAAPGGRRVTLAAMMAFTDPGTCLHWS